MRVVHAGADLQQVAPQQADGQGDGGHHLKVDQRTQADFADALDITGRSDAVDHGEKHQRRDGGLDQLEEDIAEDLETGGQFRGEKTEGDAEKHGGDDLESQVLVERFFCGGG